MNRAEAEAYGKVGQGNTKMPGSVYSLAAGAGCPTGSKLMQIKDSVCSKCYAVRLMAFRPNAKRAWEKNQLVTVASIDRHPHLWISAISWQIKRAAEKGEPYHRWFDSGDLQSVEMLDAIVAVCRKTPDVKHWLPTREVGIVQRWSKAGGRVPKNLTIRVSSPMVDQKAICGLPSGVKTSTVHRSIKPSGAICEASKRSNQCGDCRACWSRKVGNVSYPLH